MKVMIATRGDTLESMLAQGLGDALWYLVVDESSSVAVPFRALGQIALDEVYAWASEHDVAAILAGSDGSHSRILISSHKTLIEFAEQLTARQALDRWRKGELALLDSPPAQEEPAQREQRAGVPRLSLVIGKRPADEAFGDSSCAIRNHEHLQLYEGGKEKE